MGRQRHRHSWETKLRGGGSGEGDDVRGPGKGWRDTGETRTKRDKEAPPACPRLTQLAMEQRPRTPPMVRGGIRLRLLKDGSAAAPSCLPLPTALPGAVTVS